jgi:hypothetical protein
MKQQKNIDSDKLKLNDEIVNFNWLNRFHNELNELLSDKNFKNFTHQKYFSLFCSSDTNSVNEGGKGKYIYDSFQAWNDNFFWVTNVYYDYSKKLYRIDRDKQTFSEFYRDDDNNWQRFKLIGKVFITRETKQKEHKEEKESEVGITEFFTTLIFSQKTKKNLLCIAIKKGEKYKLGFSKKRNGINPHFAEIDVIFPKKLIMQCIESVKNIIEKSRKRGEFGKTEKREIVLRLKDCLKEFQAKPDQNQKTIEKLNEFFHLGKPDHEGDEENINRFEEKGLLLQILVNIAFSPEGLKYIYFIPALCLEGFEAVGGIILATKKPIISEHISFLSRLVTSIYDDLSLLLLKQYADNVRTFGINSATASIMTRNFSHNIGSHILCKIKDKLNRLTESTKEQYKKRINAIQKLLGGGYQISGDNKNDYLRGVKHLITFLQERQDFIASITSDEDSPICSLNLKDHLFDFINIDWKTKRHGMPLTKSIFLEHIAESENIKRERLSFTFGKYNGKDGNTGNQSPNEDEQLLRKLDVAVPSGIMGRQAILSIIENFIRNSAKHSKTPKNGKLEINLYTPDLKFSNDNIELNEKHLNYDPYEYIKFSLSDNLGNYKDSSKIINIALHDNLIDKDGKFKPNYKGIKEMQISAAWLRKIHTYSIDSFKESYNDGPPVLSLAPDKSDNSQSVEYIFYLLRPKNILIIFNNEDEKKCFKTEELKKYGIDCFLKDELNGKKLRHFFCLFPKDLKDTEILPYRKQAYQLCSENCKIKINDATVLDFKVYNDSISIDHLSSLLDHFISDEFPHVLNSHKTIIGIGDGEAFNNVDSCGDENSLSNYDPPSLVIKRDTSGILDCIDHDKSNYLYILYLTHNDTRSQFLANLQKFLNNRDKIGFLEGISGGNSTNRIIRNSITLLKKNRFERLKLLEYSLCKVLIIDERIFDTLSSIPIDKVNGFNDNLHKQIEYIKKNNNSSIDPRDYEDNIFYYFLYGFKNIEIANMLVVDDEIAFFNLIGDKIFTINTTQKDITTYMSPPYDFLSIHQGLIDKIRDNSGLDIKGESDDNDSLEKIFKKDNKLWKQFIVHSGRSIPAQGDFFSYALFLQFASLEAALYDSKYTLADLFYSLTKSKRIY